MRRKGRPDPGIQLNKLLFAEIGGLLRENCIVSPTKIRTNLDICFIYRPRQA
jgi:hypothetical protein